MNYSKSVDSKLKTTKEKYKYYDDNFFKEEVES